jgi:hypothetical protein
MARSKAHCSLRSWSSLFSVSLLVPFSFFLSIIVQIMLLVKPLLLNHVHKRAAKLHSSSLAHNNRENDLLGEEFGEEEPLLGRPHGAIERSAAPFCFGIFGIQGIAGADSHDEDHKEVCVVVMCGV